MRTQRSGTVMHCDFHDIRTVSGYSTSIVIDNGKIEEIASNLLSGAGIRALTGGSWGFVTTDDLTGINSALTSAEELSASIDRMVPREKVTLAPIRNKAVSMRASVKENPGDIPIEEKIELIRDIEQHARVDGVTSTTVVYSESYAKIRYQNSEGLDLEHDTFRTGFAVTAVASDGTTYQSGRKSRFGVCGYELFKKHDALALAEEAGTTATRLLRARPPEGGAMPCVLDPELAGVFIHEAVGHAAEADLVLEDSSILAGRIGSTIAAPGVTVYDDPTMDGYGQYPFDAEGVPAKRTTLIDRGVLCSYLHSRETAGKLGESGNGDAPDRGGGNARAQGCAIPIPRMSNTFIANGDMKFEEIIEELKNGVYLKGSRGGQVNTGEGIFQFNAELGFVVRDGEICEMLRDVSLSGQTLEILKNITAVGNDLKFNSGWCGKSGQTVPVSDGSPHILVSSAVVGGSG
ncbi:MAG: TldD/PmbA family protein [Methanosarcinales archaeon]|nr:TldD/PmbA family protein [Methanosarcinales archaeon]MCK4652257.1 TldD/PmbA family protein [Methanosarcinales archaeon]MCK4810917.1 TldD/PmbA family protein [Methanosarcinales archaeon]